MLLRFKCPKCGSQMRIQKTFDGRGQVSCACGTGDMLGYNRNEDEMFLEFLARYDRGLASTDLAPAGVRKKEEIDKMIKEHRPEKIIRDVLYTKDDYIADYRVLESGETEMGRTPREMGLDHSLCKSLEELGINTLYAFQDEAVEKIAAGESVAIEAPTASGKTEAFLIPVLQRILGGTEGGVFALFIYPTKALAQDQYPKISQLADSLGIRAAVFDGDTPAPEREKIIANPPDILITNFDVIHYHLWHKTRFSFLLRTAKVAVVDEAHQYTGIFGSNVHYIIKRLKRVCGNMQFVAASATLEEPGKFCQELFGQKVSAVRGAGKKGAMDFVMLFPALRKQRALMIDLVKKMTEKNHKTMAFSNSHKNSELLTVQARKKGIGIMVHRAGLGAGYRRMVEDRFKDGRLKAISCTPTLELGMDIGDVDCVVSGIVPVNRLLQRIGRAARKGQRGYAFLALGNDPISQYYRNHPDDYFADTEKSYIDPGNPFVEDAHMLAMALDRDIMPDEVPEHRGAIERHVIRGSLLESGKKVVPNIKKATQILEKYNIRGMGSIVDIFHSGKKIGDRVLPIALEELHKDAIYLHGGKSYKVAEYVQKKNHARLESISQKHPYYTKALTMEMPTIQEEYGRRIAGGVEVAFCRLHIQKKVYGYANIELGDDSGQGQKVMLEEPLIYDFDTKGIVFCAPRPTKEIERADHEEYEDGAGIDMQGCMAPEYVETSAYHATEHVVIEGSNMITGGASQDLGGISMGASGMIYVYDGAIGGSGASRALYDRLEGAFGRAKGIVAECPCTSVSGCPRCTYSYRCGNNNEFLHKASALEVFERINSGEQTRISGHEGSRPIV